MTGPTKGTAAWAVRRLVLFDRASVAIGGAAKLADVLGIDRRSVHRKLAAERGLDDRELLAAAGAVEARIAELTTLAADLRAMT